MDRFDARTVARSLGQRHIARDHRRAECLRQGDVHGVVGGDVLAQLPRAGQEIEMRVPVEIEVDEIGDRVRRTGRRDLARAHEPPEPLCHLDVHQVWRMEFIGIAKEPCLDAPAERGLQQELQHRRRVDDDHADSRSSRITVAAGVFSVTGLRVWMRRNISSRVGRAARRSSSASK